MTLTTQSDRERKERARGERERQTHQCHVGGVHHVELAAQVAELEPHVHILQPENQTHTQTHTRTHTRRGRKEGRMFGS